MYIYFFAKIMLKELCGSYFLKINYLFVFEIKKFLNLVLYSFYIYSKCLFKTYL